MCAIHLYGTRETFFAFAIQSERAMTVPLPDFPLEASELLALGHAYIGACEELGIGDGSLDVVNRERIAKLLLGLILNGETNVEALRRRAVLRYTNTPTSAEATT